MGLSDSSSGHRMLTTTARGQCSFLVASQRQFHAHAREALFFLAPRQRPLSPQYVPEDGQTLVTLVGFGRGKKVY